MIWTFPLIKESKIINDGEVKMKNKMKKVKNIIPKIKQLLNALSYLNIPITFQWFTYRISQLRNTLKN